MFNNLYNKKILILGFSFKKDTSDTRESASIYVCKNLLEEGAKLHIYDPKVPKEKIIEDLNTDNIKVESDPYEGIKDAHAIVILTEWNIFKEYDYEEFYNKMSKPAYVFDGRRIIDKKKLTEIGFDVYQIGSSKNNFEL